LQKSFKETNYYFAPNYIFGCRLSSDVLRKSDERGLKNLGNERSEISQGFTERGRFLTKGGAAADFLLLLFFG
jgi:hypothetical protein